MLSVILSYLGALSYLDQCIVDWDEEDLKNPSAYSWEGDNYSRGYSPHLIGLGRLESAFALLVRLLWRAQQGTERIVSESKVRLDLNTWEGPLACLVRLPREGTTMNQRCVSCGVQPRVRIKRRIFFQNILSLKKNMRTYQSLRALMEKEVYELPVIESLDVNTACIQGVEAVLNPGVHGSK